MAKKKKPAAKIEVEKKPEEDCSTPQKAKKIKDNITRYIKINYSLHFPSLIVI